MDEILERTVIRTVAVSEIESAVTVAAERTDTVRTEREIVQERSAARGAVELGREGLRSAETSFTNGNSSYRR